VQAVPARDFPVIQAGVLVSRWVLALT